MKYKVIMLVRTNRTLALDLRKQIRDKVNEMVDVLVTGMNVKDLKPKEGTIAEAIRIHKLEKL